MHSVLLVIEKPNRSDIGREKAWDDLKKALPGILNKYETIQKLSENVLLIPLQSALPAFGNLIYVAQSNQLFYQVLFLDQEPEWICSK
jgi:hypothetical protein